MPVSYTHLLLSDGLVSLRVDAIEDKDIVTTVLNSGVMGTMKRVAVPGVAVSLPPISDRDREDILFGMQQDMDFLAASFVQRAADVQEIRRLIEENGGHMEDVYKRQVLLFLLPSVTQYKTSFYVLYCENSTAMIL